MLTPTNLGDQLDRDEGKVLRAYDDATGVVITPGTVVKGNVTIGTGRNLSGPGISEQERLYLRTNDINNATAAVHIALPWTVGLDLVRYSVLLNLAFNLGIHGLMEFQVMLEKLHAGDNKGAAAALLDSKLATEEPARAMRLSVQLDSGQWQ